MVVFVLCLMCNVLNADDCKSTGAQCSKQLLLSYILDGDNDDLAIAPISKCAMIENQSC